MYTLIVGDLEPDLPITVYNSDESPADLATATTIELQWVKPDGTESFKDLDAIDLGVGQLMKIWEDGDTDMVGYHRGRVVVDRDLSTQEHFPNDGSWLYWLVSAA